MNVPTEWLNSNSRCEKIHDTLYEINEVFTPEALEYFYDYFRFGDKWQFVTPFTRLFRELDCHTSSSFYPAKQALDQMISTITGRSLQTRTAKLFFDTTSYQTSPHYDHPNIAAMVQIYFPSPNPICPGTLFFEPKIHLVRYQANCGYINLNHDLKVHQSNQLSRDYRCSLALQLV